MPFFVKRPRPESATAIAPSIVESHIGLSQERAGQSVNLACTKIDEGETRPQGGDRAATLPQSQAPDILLHGPGLTGTVGRIEAVYCRSLNVDPVKDFVYWAPYGRFAEKSRDGENTFDLRQRLVTHALLVL